MVLASRLLLAAGLLVGSAVSTIIPVTGPPRIMVPVNKRMSGVQRRTMASEGLLPRKSVDMSFGEQTATTNRQYVAHVKLHGYDNLPLLSLEDFEILTTKIQCQPGEIEITFADAADAQKAYDYWSAAGTFVLVSSHPQSGCNSDDDRAPHQITDLTFDEASNSLSLAASPLDWHDATRRASLELRHLEPEVFAHRLHRRQKVDVDPSDPNEMHMQKNFSLAMGSPTARVPLYPRPAANATEEDPAKPSGKPDPADPKNPSADPKDPKTPSTDKPAGGVDSGDANNRPELNLDFAVTCVGCHTTGRIDIEAYLDIDYLTINKRAAIAPEIHSPKEIHAPAPRPNTEGISEFLDTVTDVDLINIDMAYFSLSLPEDLTARAELEFFLGAGLNYQFTRSILPRPIVVSPFQLGTFISIGPHVDFEIAVDIGAEVGGLNFTYGAELVVPKGAGVHLDFGERKKNESGATGWGDTDVRALPFKLNSLGDEMMVSLNLTARAKVDLAIIALGGAAGELAAGVSMDLPKLHNVATLVKNVTNTCAELGESDFEYHPYALNVTSGVSLGLSATARTDVPFTKLEVLNQEWENELWKHQLASEGLCWGFDKKVLGEVKNVEKEAMLVDVEKLRKVVEENGVPEGVTAELLAKAGLDEDGEVVDIRAAKAASEDGDEEDAAGSVRAGLGLTVLAAVGVAMIML